MNSSVRVCQCLWLDHAPGLSSSRFTPSFLNPAAIASRYRTLFRHGVANGSGYLLPAEIGAFWMSIFFMGSLSMGGCPSCLAMRRLPRKSHQLHQHRFAGVDQLLQRDARCAFA